MKKLKFIALIAAAIIAVPLLVFSVPRLYRGHRIRELKTVDQQALVDACRALISAHQMELTQTEQVGVESQLTPLPIMKLKPKYVLVRKDHVLICVSVIPRLYIMGFADDALQFGRERLRDGLWWSADPGREQSRLRKVTPPDRRDLASRQATNEPPR